jgi:hypothetical protein
MPTTAQTRRSVRPTRTRPSAPQRRGIAGGWLHRQPPQKQSAFKRAVGALPGRAKKPAAKRSGRSGKVGALAAVLAGAAGLAFKNREKVASMTRRGSNGSPQH